MTADMRAEVICVVTSRGGWISTTHNTATMTMASEERSNTLPSSVMVAYSEATATTAGMTAWMTASTAIRKLCLNKTGWVIRCPLNRSHRYRCSRVVEVRQTQCALSGKFRTACVIYIRNVKLDGLPADGRQAQWYSSRL